MSSLANLGLMLPIWEYRLGLYDDELSASLVLFGIFGLLSGLG